MIRATIANPITISGIGIHSGANCEVTLTPSTIGTGICFRVPDTCGNISEIPATVAYSLAQSRASLLVKETAKILTPEHLLAALFGVGVSDAIITLSSPEVPILDGSATPFVNELLQAGIVQSGQPWFTATVPVPIICNENDASVLALPDPGLRFSMIIEYDNFIGTQSITWDYDTRSFVTDIAPARTYAFKAEIDQLLAAGLGKGGTLDNAVVIGDSEYLSKLRFDDELVRHKLLDLIGDLSLVGTHLQGHFVGIRSGHALNRQLALRLAALPGQHP
ncbi:UDP-3-O-[3-hydroxymyristoyl] N-acetylglucosamine deacetylase [bacterium]|nr:UDP-3-O-[3-hydroxymyristoyl] N-acetylglucosamine deacetylase [bacterium]